MKVRLPPNKSDLLSPTPEGFIWFMPFKNKLIYLLILVYVIFFFKEKRIEESAVNELDQNAHEVSTSAQNYKRESLSGNNEQVKSPGWS